MGHVQFYSGCEFCVEERRKVFAEAEERRKAYAEAELILKPDFRCYICGQGILPTKYPASFYLVTLSPGTDRVFIMHGGACLDRVKRDPGIVITQVSRV